MTIKEFSKFCGEVGHDAVHPVAEGSLEVVLLIQNP